MSVLGVGVDTVDLDAFATSLAEPGTRFAAVFSAAEQRQARERALARGADTSTAALARHLGARWAAKEAMIKAWSAALYGRPPVISPERLDWAQIEVVADAWGRPGLRLHGEVAAAVADSLGSVRWHLSLTHDGPAATAFVVCDRVSGDAVTGP